MVAMAIPPDRYSKNLMILVNSSLCVCAVVWRHSLKFSGIYTNWSIKKQEAGFVDHLIKKLVIWQFQYFFFQIFNSDFLVFM